MWRCIKPASGSGFWTPQMLWMRMLHLGHLCCLLTVLKADIWHKWWQAHGISKFCVSLSSTTLVNKLDSFGTIRGGCMAHPGLGVPDVSVVSLEALRSVVSWTRPADLSLFSLEARPLDLGFGFDFWFGFGPGDGFLDFFLGRRINSEKSDESDEKS